MNIAGNPYSPYKILHQMDRIDQMRRGGQPVPLQVQIIISDFCNHNCGFCAYRLDGYTSNSLFKQIDAGGVVNNNPMRMIPIEKVFEILEDCRAMGVRAIQFTGGGEPTVHPEHKLIFQRTLDLGLDLALVSNGTILRDGMPALLANAKWVRISVDAGRAETYARTREVPTSYFDRVWGNIRELRAARDASLGSQLIIGVGFVVTRENFREIYDATCLAAASGADNIRISAVFTPEEYQYHEQFCDEARSLAAKAVEEHDGVSGFRVFNLYGDRVQDLVDRRPEYSYCGYMHLNTYIGGDMNVYTCCNNAYNASGLVGSIRSVSFKDLWMSREKVAYFEQFDARKCERCMFNNKNRIINYALEAHPLHVNYI